MPSTGILFPPKRPMVKAAITGKRIEKDIQAKLVGVKLSVLNDMKRKDRREGRGWEFGGGER